MEDIGMSPDYRSGVSDRGTCDICGETGDAYYLETCSECGRQVCPDCCVDYGVRVVCLVCEGE